jgi:hypothetical protein
MRSSGILHMSENAYILRAKVNMLGYRRSFSGKDVATTPPDRNVNTPADRAYVQISILMLVLFFAAGPMSQECSRR